MAMMEASRKRPLEDDNYDDDDDEPGEEDDANGQAGASLREEGEEEWVADEPFRAAALQRGEDKG